MSSQTSLRWDRAHRPRYSEVAYSPEERRAQLAAVEAARPDPQHENERRQRVLAIKARRGSR